MLGSLSKQVPVCTFDQVICKTFLLHRCRQCKRISSPSTPAPTPAAQSLNSSYFLLSSYHCYLIVEVAICLSDKYVMVFFKNTALSILILSLKMWELLAAKALIWPENTWRKGRQQCACLWVCDSNVMVKAFR